jgi:hypothetical protein
MKGCDLCCCCKKQHCKELKEIKIRRSFRPGARVTIQHKYAETKGFIIKYAPKRSVTKGEDYWWVELLNSKGQVVRVMKPERLLKLLRRRPKTKGFTKHYRGN